MAIVGEAVVRVRVISNTLSRDIANNVRDGFRAAGPELDRSGQQAGRRAGAAAAEGVRESTPEMRRAGGDIGQRFVDAMDTNIRRSFRRALIPNITNSLREGIQDGVRGGGASNASTIIRGFNLKAFVTAGHSLGRELHRGFNLGIGSARMGPAVRSALLLALPSVLSGAGSLGAAMASQIISSIAASGPAIAGAVGVLAAALSTALLNFGLLYAAFKSGNKELDDAVTKFKALAQEIGKPIAAGMLNGFQEFVSLLQGGIPQINDMLEETGRRFGEMFRSLGQTVTRADNLSRIRDILGTNNSFIDNFSKGLNGLTSSFLILFNAAKPFIDYLGQGIAKFGEWAEKTLLAKEASGELGTFMDNLLESFKQGLDTIVDFGVGIWNVFKAARAGAGSIGDIAEKFRAWTSNPENQERMERFFEKMHILAGALIGLFGGLAAAAGGALEKMDLTPILKVFEILTEKIAPALADLWNQVQSGAGENLVKIFDNLGTMLQKIVDSGSFEMVARFISDLLVKVSEFLASDFGATIAAWLIPLGLFAGVLTSLIGPITTIIGLFTGPFALIIGIILAVAATFATIWANSEKFRESIGKLVTAVAGTFSEIWEKLVPKVQALWEAFQELAGVIGDRLAPIIEFLVPVIQRVFNFIGDTIGNIIDVFRGFINIVIGIFTGDWGRIWEGVVIIFTAIWEQVKNVFFAAKDFISFIWDAITSVIYNAGQVIYGFITSVFNGIWDFIVMVWSAIYDFFDPILSGIADKIREFGNAIPVFLTWVWETVSTAVVTAWNAIFDFFNNILTSIADGIRTFGNNIPIWLNQAWEAVKNGAITAWNAVFDFFNTILTNIADGIRNFGNAIPPFLAGIWENVKNAARIAWEAIKIFASTIWNGIKDTIVGIAEDLWATLVGWWDSITSSVSSAWGGLEGIVSGIWNGIKSAIIDPIAAAYNQLMGWVGAIRDLIQGAWDTVSGIIENINNAIAATADQVVAAGGLGLGANTENPFGPAAAEGGIFRPTPGGQRVIVAEAGRTERIEPLDPTGLSQRDRAIIAQLAGSEGSGGGNIIKVFIGQRELDVVVDTQVEKANRSLGRSLSNGKRV